jgi:hypothetical protein
VNEKTIFKHGGWVEGQGDAAEEVVPEPVEAGGQIFPSAWHRDRFISDCERERAYAEQKLSNPALTAEQRAELEVQRQAATRELERLTKDPEPTKAKKPA